MEESFLPDTIRSKASVSIGGEHAWRKGDFVEVIQAARTAGLAAIGGQVQFQFPDGTCEAYWLDYKAVEEQPDEQWHVYVERSAREVSEQFHALCDRTDFSSEALTWAFIRNKVNTEGMNPIDHLWFIIYFQAKDGTLP